MSSKQKLIPARWKQSDFLIILLFIFIAGCGDRDETNKQRFLIRGNEALTQQNYREAMRFFGEAIAIDSCYVPAINNSGIVQFEQQHYGQAILLYDRALLCDPENYDASLNRSNAFFESGELYRAEDDLNFLLRKHPDSATIYFRLGLVHARMKRFKVAVDDFGSALKRDSLYTEALINRGTVWYYLNELDKSEADLKKALRQSTKDEFALNTLGMIYSKRGNVAQAMNYVEQALAFAPGDPYLLNNLGFLYLLAGDLETARENIDNSIARDPSNAWAYRNKGRYYHLKKDYTDALRLYDRALRENDFVELIYTYRGDAFQAMGNSAKACAAWKKGVEEGEFDAGKRLSEFNCI